MDTKYEVTINGETFGANSWKELALGIAAAMNTRGADMPDLPTYVLRADVPEHRATLFGMVQAGRELRHKLLPGLETAAREFEMYEEAHR
jgi:hypothetical protein